MVANIYFHLLGSVDEAFLWTRYEHVSRSIETKHLHDLETNQIDLKMKLRSDKGNCDCLYFFSFKEFIIICGVNLLLKFIAMWWIWPLTLTKLYILKILMSRTKLIICYNLKTKFVLRIFNILNIYYNHNWTIKRVIFFKKKNVHPIHFLIKHIELRCTYFLNLNE